MAKLSLETRLNKLEKLAGKEDNSDEFFNVLSPEELVILLVAVTWNVDGLFEEYKSRMEDSPVSEEDRLELEKLLSAPLANGWALDGWNAYASKEVKKAYPDIPNKISALKETH